jgi:hypothetical protein
MAEVETAKAGSTTAEDLQTQLKTALDGIEHRESANKKVNDELDLAKAGNDEAVTKMAAA